MAAQRGNARWLGVLFAESAALLLLQLALGFWGNSLALLADAGHTCADVISYGVNCLVEWVKVAAQSRGNAEGVVDRSARIDLWGCLVTTLLLCTTTWFAAAEAVDRLQDSERPASLTTPRATAVLARDGAYSEAGHFNEIGVALLIFSLVSTAANVGTLAIYRTCSRRVRAASPLMVATITDNAALMAGRAEQEMVCGAPGADLPPPPPPPPAATAASSSFTARGRRRREEAPAGIALNLTSSFSTASAGNCSDAACLDKICCTDRTGDLRVPIAASVSASSAQSARPSTWTATMHSLVHPGCGSACGGHGVGGDAGASPSNGEAGPASFNVVSAILHLVADISRGLTILVVAVLIEAGVIENPGRADAVCALLVAAFVAMGSLELLRRVGTSLYRGSLAA